MTMETSFFDDYNALIFDLDGTLVDSMPLHNEAWIHTVAKRGKKLDEQTLYELAGITTKDTVDILNKRFRWDLDRDEIANEKESYYLERLENLKASSRIVGVVKKYFQKLPLAIVTGGERKTVEQVLGRLNLNKYFSVVICAEDTREGKREAAPFLAASRALNVPPEKCLVFEDGEPGIKGALKAGMGTVKVDLRSDEIFVDKSV